MSRELLEESAREIGHVIGDSLPPGVGFALLVFDFGSTLGHLAWISNAQRADMIKSLKEMVRRLEAGMGAKDTDS